jgi:hypothetical protein
LLIDNKGDIMIRNLKALGLALAVLAMSAMTPPIASATDFFTSTKSTAWLTGTSHDNVFSLGGTKFECTTTKFAATISNGSSEATTLPSYTGRINETPHGTACDATLGTLTWDVNGCHYKLTGNTTGSDGGTDATTWIECPTGKSIQTTSSAGPVISIPSQTPTEGGVTYTNLPNHPGGSAVKVTMTVTGITSTCAPSFTCGLAGIPTHANSLKWTGTMTLTGYEDLGGTLGSPIEGSQIPVEWS